MAIGTRLLCFKGAQLWPTFQGASTAVKGCGGQPRRDILTTFADGAASCQLSAVMRPFVSAYHVGTPQPQFRTVLGSVRKIKTVRIIEEIYRHCCLRVYTPKLLRLGRGDRETYAEALSYSWREAAPFSLALGLYLLLSSTTFFHARGTERRAVPSPAPSLRMMETPFQRAGWKPPVVAQTCLPS